MSGFNTEFTELFRDETMRRLEEMDNMLLAVESGDGSAEAVNSLFRHAHTIKGAAGMLGFPEVRGLAHASEDVLAKVREQGRFPPALAAPLLHATAAMRTHLTGAGTPIDGVLADLAASQELLASDPADTGPGDTGPGDTGPGGQEPGGQKSGGQEPGGQEPGGQEARPAGGAGTVPPQGSSPEAGSPGGPPGTSPPGGVTPPGEGSPARGQPALKVPAGKIDHLLDLAGEVMQYRRGLAHTLGRQPGLPGEVADMLDSGERMLDDLKATAVGMRTLPLSAITASMPRVVRDLARTAGKEVDLEVTGAGTELDRAILESLSEPLTHLLGNAVVHGIEPAGERERAGKPRRGRLGLHAVPRGSLVEIEVADDGRGVAADVIAQTRHGLSLADLLAQPGYSTAEEVTELAGRGVGLDAVKSYVNSVGGTLEVRSEPGRGMAVILLLPLALALAEMLLLERGEAVFGVPLAAVEEVVTVEDTVALLGRRALAFRGRSLPIADLADLVGLTAPGLGGQPPGVVVSGGGRQAIVTCDALLGAVEVVVKPLGPLLARADGYLGASILGDGRIALLVEPTVLTRPVRLHPGRAGPRPAAAPAASPDPPTAARVLVVEDSFTVRELQRSILETAGFDVVTARDGQEALRSVDRDPRISLVIADLEMPGLNGVELTRAIRARDARASLPVIIVTKHGSDEDRRRGIEAGADAYIAKRHFDQQDLLATVERLIGRP